MARKRRLGRPVDQKGRSKGEGQFAPLPYVMLNSAAWRSLSGPAVKVFLELRTRFHGANNGRLVFSLEEGRRLLNLGKSTVRRALAELQDKGFIVCMTKGQWYGRLASTWAVTDRPIDGVGAAQTWKQWRPPSTPPPKTKVGSNTAPSPILTVPPQDRRLLHRAATEPVRAIRLVATGSGMGR
jgi:hypothetical protein